MADQRRFNLVTNGYDCYQVNSEIDRLEYQIQELNEKILMYQKQIETVNNQFSMIKKRYQLLVSELQTREKQADDVARLALKEANSMIEEAQKNADEIIQSSITEVESYLDEIREYDQKTSANNQAVKEAVANLLDVLNQYDDIEIPDPFKKEDK